MFRALKALLACFAAVVITSGCVTPAVDENAGAEDVLLEIAATAEQNGEYSVAASHYGTLHAKYPGNTGVVFALARNLRYTGSAAQAVKVLEAAGDRLAGRPGYELALAKALLASGNSVRAVDILLAVATVEPKNWEIHSTLGIAHDLADDFGAARKAYEHALALSPDNPAILNNMAISFALSGDLDGAIQVLKQTPRVARHSPQIRQNLAFFYGIQGDMESAKALAKIDLDDDTVRKNLEIYAQFGRN